MIRLHESFERLKTPGHIGLQRFLEQYAVWSQEGIPPPYSRFDFLDWPDLVSWITVVHFPSCAENRYAAQNARVLFDGSARVEMFAGDMTGQSGADLEDLFLDRWVSIYSLCVREAAPVFARSQVYGVDKEFAKFEIGLFPFSEGDGDGSVSHVLSPALRIR